MARIGVIVLFKLQLRQWSGSCIATPGAVRLCSQRLNVDINRTVTVIMRMDQQMAVQMWGLKYYGIAFQYTSTHLSYEVTIATAPIVDITIDPTAGTESVYYENNYTLTFDIDMGDQEILLSIRISSLCITLKSYAKYGDTYTFKQTINKLWNRSCTTDTREHHLPRGGRNVIDRLLQILELYNYFDEYIPDWLPKLR